MDLSQAVNQPIAIVAIIVACSFAFREIVMGIKTIQGKTPYQDLAGTMKDLGDAIRQLNTNMQMQSRSLEQLSKDFDRSFMSVIRHIDSIAKHNK